MKYQAIIFDFFDVVYADATKRWRKSKGIKMEGSARQASIDADLGLISVAEFYQRLADIAGVSVKQMQAELEEHRILNSEILPLIKKLGKHYKVGLLSNSPSKLVRDLLRKHDLDPLFHHIVISAEVNMLKPDRDIFHHILAKLHAAPEQAIFIDDNEENVHAAEKYGITGVLYLDMKTLKKDLKALGIVT